MPSGRDYRTRSASLRAEGFGLPRRSRHPAGQMKVLSAKAGASGLFCRPAGIIGRDRRACEPKGSACRGEAAIPPGK